MRGEETQILGALAGDPHLANLSLVVLPRTHSKWVLVRNGLIESFSTHMTGELFAILREYSILGRPAREAIQGKSDEAFNRGLHAARDAAAEGISSRLFSVRSLFLTDEHPAEHQKMLQQDNSGSDPSTRKDHKKNERIDAVQSATKPSYNTPAKLAE